MNIVSTLFRGAMFAVLCTTLGACQTLGGAGLIASTVTTQLTPISAAAIAGDMVGQLAAHHGPGGTTLRLRSDSSAFGHALEETLRATGYAVVSDTPGGNGVVELAFVVDSFEGNVLVRLSSTALDLTRMYRVEGESAVPMSPMSVLQRDQAEPA